MSNTLSFVIYCVFISYIKKITFLLFHFNYFVFSIIPEMIFNTIITCSQEYQCKVAIDADKAAPLIAKLEKLRDAKFDEILEENPKWKKVLKKLDIGTVEYDDDGEETGRIIFRFKQKAQITYKNKKGEEETFDKKVALVDSKGKFIKAPVKIGTGSVVKVSFEPNAYFSPKDKEIGISFNRLMGVQLITLVEYEGDGMPSAEDLGFGDEGEEDGFDASAYTVDGDEEGGPEPEGEMDF